MSAFRFRRVRPVDADWREQDAGPLANAPLGGGPQHWTYPGWRGYPADLDDAPLFMPYPRVEKGALTPRRWVRRPADPGTRLLELTSLGRYLFWLFPGCALLMPAILVPGLLLSLVLLARAARLSALRLRRAEAVAVHGRLWDRLLDIPNDRSGKSATLEADIVAQGLDAALDRAALRPEALAFAVLLVLAFALFLARSAALIAPLLLCALAAFGLGFAIACWFAIRKQLADSFARTLAHDRGWVLGNMIALRGLGVAPKHIGTLRTLTQKWLMAMSSATLPASVSRLFIGWVLIFGAAVLLWSAQSLKVPLVDLVSGLLFAVPSLYAASELGRLGGEAWSCRKALRDIAPVIGFDHGDSGETNSTRIEQIEFESVGYAYDHGVPVLRDVSLVLRRGEVLALVGPSGGGKSTLLRLLMGLARPTHGRIKVNAGTLSSQSPLFRSQIAAVFQDQDLGFSTIRNAVLHDRPEADLAAAWQALDIVGLKQKVEAMPMGIQTLLVAGAFPFALTRQVLIARALVQESDLLVLDEALSALDLDTARAIIDKARARGTMVVFSTHRADLQALADTVLDLAPQDEA